MYEDDTPPAERRAQALSLDRDLLRELLGQEELRELLDPDALAEVEASAAAGDAATPDQLHDLLRLRGDLRTGEFDEAHAAIARGGAARDPRPHRRRGAADRRRGRGPLPRRARRDAAVGAARRVPRGRAGLAAPARAALRAGRGPFTTAQANERFGVDVEPLLRELEQQEQLVRGELRPGGTEREWCDPDVLRRLRRASLAALRREVEPVEQAALGRFLPRWHGVDRRASLREALVPLQGLALPVSLWESEVLPRRVPGYRPEQLDALCATGEVVWVGAGLDRVARLLPRGRAGARPVPAPRRRRRSEQHDGDPRGARERRAVLVRPARRDAARGRDRAAGALGSRLGRRGDERRSGRRCARSAATGAPQPGAPRRAASPARARAGPTATQGRWSRTERRSSPATPDRRALAELLLERQGIVTRDGVRAEGIAGGYGAVYAELRALETLGLCRRGYFVEGLGGAQFALGGRGRAAARAARRARTTSRSRSCSPPPIPAQPYGAALPWPKRAGARAARVAGAHVVLLGGERGAVRRARRPLARAAARPGRGLAAARARRARRARASAAARSGSRSSGSTASR